MRIYFNIFALVIFSTVLIPQMVQQSEQERIKNWEKEKREFSTTGKTKLKKVNSFPANEESVFLKSAEHFSIDKSGNVYVAEAMTGIIKIFDLDGKFKKQIGTRGQGPGDFFNAKQLYFDENSKQLIVNDMGNMRFQFLDTSYKYKSSFKIFKPYVGVSIDEKGSIYGHPLGTPTFDEPLVEVFDYSGKKTGEFGNRINFFNTATDKWNRVLSSVNRKGEIYVAWEWIPLVKKYSADGKILKEYKINNERMLAAAEFNRIQSANAQGNALQRVCIQALRAKDSGGFYLFTYSPYIQIIEFDDQGNQVKSYFGEQDYNLIGSDFSVVKRNGKTYFYILKLFPDNQIDVFCE